MGDELIFLTDIFVQYMGTGFYMLLFFICFLYIPFKADEKTRQILFYPLLAIFVLVAANPLMVWFWGVIGMDVAVYWRTYWLLLMTEVIAYVAVSLVHRWQTRAKKCLVATAVVCIIVLCGSFIITPQNYTRPDNVYKLDAETIAVADILINENPGMDRISVPIEMLDEIRQYTMGLFLTYGREIVHINRVAIVDEEYGVYARNIFDMLHRFSMEYSEPLLEESLENTNTRFLVQEKDSHLTPLLDEAPFLQLLAETQEHNIYEYTA